MPEEHSLESVPQDSNGRSGRPEFVQFRNRIQRLVESLACLRNLSMAGQGWREQERVEVKLESAAVIVEFFIAQLSWETANELAHHFQSSFANFAPVFLDAPAPRIFKLGKSREKEGSYRQLHILEDTALTLQWDPLNAGYSVKIQTNLNDFNDHFEVFVTDAARKLLPATGRRAKEHVVDLESWYKEFGHAELVQHLDGWNFRQIAQLAEEVVRSYVSNLDLSLLEAGDPPLPRKEDYLAGLRSFTLGL